VLRQKIDRRFFNSNARLFLSVDGVRDRIAESRILSAITHKLHGKNDSFDLVAVRLDNRFSVVSSNHPDYGLGDVVTPALAPFAKVNY
jgi:hypothetical protein